MLKAIKHCKSRVCCKYHLHRYRRLVKSHDNLNSVPLWHPSHAHCWLSVVRHHSVPSVVAYNYRMLDCKKNQSGFIVEFVQTRWTFFVVVCECRYPCTSLHRRGKQQQSQSSWLLVLFFSHLAILVAMDEFALANIHLINLIDATMQVSLHWASFALAYEDSIVHRDLHRGRTCDGSLQLSLRLNLLVREIRRDRRLRSRSSSRSTYSFAKLVAIELKYSLRSCSWSHNRVEILVAIMFVIARSCPVHRNLHRDRTCKGLTDRRSAIKAIGKLEHSRAASFSRLHERNSASRSSQPFSGLEVNNFTSATRLLVVSWAYMGLKRGC
jgi:hypothetical protein